MENNKYQLVSEDIFKQFRNANYNLQFNGCKTAMERFKKEYPNEYTLITTQWRKRVVLNECIGALFASGQDVYWGSLTFDDEHDKSTIKNKRQQAIRHLNKCFSAWVLVEEYGTDNGRYHIHFIAIFKYDKTIVNDFSQWHSREDIERVFKKNKKNVTQYLTNYFEKQAPRIRKSENMLAMLKKYKQAKRWSKLDFNTLEKNTLNELKYIAEELPF